MQVHRRNINMKETDLNYTLGKGTVNQLTNLSIQSDTTYSD